MSASRELVIPDIGDFKSIPVIEVFVKPGDIVTKDAPLVTLESDKATLDVPSDFAGTIQELRIKVGDRVSQGTVIAILQTETSASPVSASSPTQPEKSAQASTTPSAESGSAAPQNQSASSQPSGQQPQQQTQEVRDVVMPDIGEFKDVPIIEIFVKVGDTIAKDAPLLTLESEKATLDIPAPFAGTLREILVKVGDRVSVGTVVAKALAGSGSPVASTAVSAAAANTAESTNGVKSVASASSGTIGTNGHASNGSANGTANGMLASGGVVIGPVHASPSIRRFARELGVTLGHVHGTGPNGRITRTDVQNWVKKALSSTPTAGQNGSQTVSGGMTVLPWPKVDFAAFGPIERVPLSRIKKLSGPNLHRNWVMIPHVTQFDEADITDLEAMRKAINAEKNVKVTMLAFLIVACVATLKRFPEVNASLEGDDLIKKGYYHIGFAADTPNGLLVPIIRDADHKGILEIAEETSALAKKARDGKLSGPEMQGGTFTISSLGGIGGTAFTPIINAPEVAILGVSRSAMKPVWDGKAFQPRLMLPLSLSYDHRVIDGAGAARFCVALAQTLADLRRALL